MNRQDQEAYIDEEAFMILHSGEIPEVTFHSSLYHLTEDPEGPGLTLDENDVLALKKAVVERYRAIILRDLDPSNRDKSIYRGLARCAANWLRLLKFCTRENMELDVIRSETAAALQNFLRLELDDVQSGKRLPSINCSYSEVENLAADLGIEPGEMPEGWREILLVWDK